MVGGRCHRGGGSRGRLRRAEAAALPAGKAVVMALGQRVPATMPSLPLRGRERRHLIPQLGGASRMRRSAPGRGSRATAEGAARGRLAPHLPPGEGARAGGRSTMTPATWALGPSRFLAARHGRLGRSFRRSFGAWLLQGLASGTSRLFWCGAKPRESAFRRRCFSSTAAVGTPFASLGSRVMSGSTRTCVEGSSPRCSSEWWDAVPPSALPRA
mmetsp:Transcript_67914/g.145392  ORF Transcript_67914/g.145392 Transcript_67914/m.145392 type:complete len:214 (-) Transcript_67914:65-706(-)